MEKIDLNKVSNFITFYNPDGSVNEALLIQGVNYLSALDEIDDLFEKHDYHLGFFLFRGAWRFSNTYVIERLGINKVLSCFEKSTESSPSEIPFIMTYNEKVYLESMNDEITVYRGGKITDKSEILISWTLNEDVAAFYSSSRGGHIQKGVVRKCNVFCFFFEEFEVVVRPHSVKITEQYLPEGEIPNIFRMVTTGNPL